VDWLTGLAVVALLAILVFALTRPAQRRGPRELRSERPDTPVSAEPDAPAKPLYLDENVQFTVYRPTRVQPAKWYPLLAFAHLAEAPSPDEDVFQLFWSWNAMRSAYVRSEWEYALTLNKPYFIRPLYWEEPMPRSEPENLPPEALARINFTRIPELSAPSPARPAAPGPMVEARGVVIGGTITGSTVSTGAAKRRRAAVPPVLVLVLVLLLMLAVATVPGLAPPPFR